MSAPSGSAPPRGGGPPRVPLQLVVIRLTMVVVVLLLGGVAYLAHRRAGFTPLPLPQTEALHRVGAGFLFTGIGVLLVLRFVFRRRIEQRSSFVPSVVAWAVAEAPALFGAAYFYVTADPTLYSLGLMLLAIALVAFPVRPPR